MAQQGSQLVEVQSAATSELLEAKLLVPAARPGSVSRTPLVNRLRASRVPVVTVVAPAGYGKTTVLAEWAGRDQRPFAWVSVAEDGNDAITLSRYIATALSRVQHVDVSTFDALGSPRRSASAATKRVASMLLAAPRPLVLVLDDVHLLRSRECANTLAALAEHVPDGSTLVLAGRTLPRLPIARVRTTGRLFEVGVDDLALSRREVELLLRGVGVELGAAEVVELTDRTEGWAAGTYLGALSLKDETSRPGFSSGVAGDDRFVADYFDFEHLSHLNAKDVRFLTRTAVLDRMSGPLCDAVLESTGSAAKLERLAGSSLFLVPLDRRREWYRFHHEFRDFLRAELRRREPELVPELNRRAAAWCEENGAGEEAVHYAHAAADLKRLTRLVTALALPLVSTGRAATVEGWLHWFEDEHRLDRYPTVCIAGAWVHLLRGRPATAKRWLTGVEGAGRDAALSDGSEAHAPWIAVLRAAMCRGGVAQMRVEAENAVCALGATSSWRPAALLLRGVAQMLLEEDDDGDKSLAEATEAAESLGATDILILALVERSLLAARCGDETGAEALTARARNLIDEAELGDDALFAIAFATCAQHQMRRGHVVQARADLAQAHALANRVTHALPWHSVQTNLELARADLALLDEVAARVSLSAADEFLRRRPCLRTLVTQAEALRAESDRATAICEGRATSLTTAELRLLPLLTTHLSFREIGERLFVSRNTVKTQAISVYRKLDVSSRSEAIARATALGLVDESTVPRAGDFIPSG